jgi:predicted O-methyltransferase YrrM
VVVERSPATEAQQLARASDAWLSPASYWTPSYLVESAWHEHAPFAAWVLDAHRPRTVVELGTHHGFSYFTWCEAAVRLGLDTRFTAIDSWEGDDHAGFYDESVYTRVVAENSQYGDRSTLLRGYFADRASDVEDGSVDLLHIDGRHAYENVRDDFELYLPKLSDRGIVLFHDVAEHIEGFGVYRFWDELAVRYPSFAFEHGHGLGVLFVGAHAADRLGSFVDAADREPQSIRDDYVALGAVVQRRYFDQLAGLNEPAYIEQLAALNASANSSAPDPAPEPSDPALEKAYQDALAEIAAIHNTKSWRWLAPARAIRGRFASR